MNRRLGVLLVFWCLLQVRPASAVPIVWSDFNSDTDGWSLRDQGRAPLHVDAGGHPGGYLAAPVSESEEDPLLWLSAPGKFRGDQLAALDGALEFDLRLGQGFTPLRPFGQVFLRHGARSIIHDIFMPEMDWTHSRIDLSGSAGWRLMLTCNEASREDMTYVLSSVDEFRIQWDTSTLQRPDFDNVLFDGEDAPPPVPEPSSLALLGAGLIAAFAFVARRRL